MYPSGQWKGFWQQEGYGRQSMEGFQLTFLNGVISGSGHDIVGPFHFEGKYDTNTGRVQMVKQYVDRHQVVYVGGPDGEGSIIGDWSIPVRYFGVTYKGPFLIRPIIDLQREEEVEFIEITR